MGRTIEHLLRGLRWSCHLALVFTASRGAELPPPPHPVNAQLDVPYAAAGADTVQRQRAHLDVHRPANAAARTPAIVWFHGGGLQEGDKADVAAFGRTLAAAGVAVFTPNYRLHPHAEYPAFVADAAQAVTWVWQRADELNVDRSRVFVGGHSAGAYLAALLVMDPRHLALVGVSADELAGGLFISGQMVTHRTVREQRGLAPHRLLVDDASPLHHLRAEAPPVLLLVAEHDLPYRVEENQLFAAALRAAGHRQVHLEQMADRDHGSIGFRIPEPDDAVARRLIDFIRTQEARDRADRRGAFPAP